MGKQIGKQAARSTWVDRHEESDLGGMNLVVFLCCGVVRMIMRKADDYSKALHGLLLTDKTGHYTPGKQGRLGERGNRERERGEKKGG